MSENKTKLTQRIPRWKIALYLIFHIVFIPVLGTGLIYAHDMITQNQYFEAKEIHVKGNTRLGFNQILNIAGLKYNDNLMELNITQVRKKLLYHPWIKKAEIKRMLPDSLEIRVKEEIPVARVRLDNLFLINNQGDIFKKNEKKDPFFNIPEVTGLNIFDIEEKNFYLQSVLEILTIEKKAENLLHPDNFSKINIDRDTGICIYNTNICKKLIMGFNNLDEKYQNLKLLSFYIKKKYPGQKLDKIDLSKKNRVIIKPLPAMG